MEQMTKGLALADKIDPAYYNVTSPGTVTTTSGKIDMTKFRTALYEIQVGAVDGPSTIDANLQSCKAANFVSNVHNIANTNITQLTTTDSNKRVSIEITADQLDRLQTGDVYVRLRTVVTGGDPNTSAGAIYGATGWGGSAEQKPASSQNLAAVKQQLIIS